ncbi:MAG: DASS family sodium-coupled anion symporter [Pseudomonadota bacterium]
MKKLLRLAACLLPAALILTLGPEPLALRQGLALLTLIGMLWMTQALDITATALLVPLLASLAGLLEPKAALAAFANPIIFLFLGGFALATALQRHGLDRELANWVLRRASGHRRRAAWLLFALTAALSMWISNTATAALMLPLALGLLGRDAALDDDVATRTNTFLLLGVAYAASLGGLGTLVGSPPNAIAAAQAGIGFAEWLGYGLPLVLVLMPLMVLVLTVVLRPQRAGRVAVPAGEFQWTRERRLTVLIFVLTGAGWIAGAPLAQALGLKSDSDSLVAVAAIVALVATRTLSWEETERGTQWGILLLFGGGLALGQVMEKSGASTFLTREVLALVEGAPLVLLLPVVLAFIVFLSELASNTAVAALLVPVLAGMAGGLGLDPVTLAVMIATAASCGFMLPVATPPNALVFGTGLVPARLMMRAGLALNLACIVTLTVATLLWR